MPIFLFTDNARSTLGQTIGPSNGQIVLASGGGALFPSPAANQLFTLTLNDRATGTVYETCYCTGRAGDVLTVARGQEGTAAQSWSIGDNAFCGPTSGTMANFVQTPHMFDASIAPTFAATQVNGGLNVTNQITSGSYGAFIDNATQGLIVTGTTIAGAGIQLIDNGGARKWIRNSQNTFQVINNAYNAVIASVDDGGNFTAAGNVNASSVVATNSVSANAGNVSAYGSVTANTGNIATLGSGQIFTSSGNITANNGRLRAGLGAYNTNDNYCATLLGDFLLSIGSGFFYERMPNGAIIQAYTGASATGGGDLITFPVAFPNNCIQVIAAESNPAGWVVGNPLSVTIFGTMNIGAGGFQLWTASWSQQNAQWTLRGGIGFRYIAVGY